VAGGKSEKGTKLKYTIQPFVRQFFDVISYVQIIARLLSLIIYEVLVT